MKGALYHVGPRKVVLNSQTADAFTPSSGGRFYAARQTYLVPYRYVPYIGIDIYGMFLTDLAPSSLGLPVTRREKISLSRTRTHEESVCMYFREIGVGMAEAWEFQSWHGPPKLSLFIYLFIFIFIVNLGPLPKNRGHDLMSFQFFF